MNSTLLSYVQAAIDKTIWERVADRSIELLMLFAVCGFLYKAVWPFFTDVINKMQSQLDVASQAREAALKQFLEALERRDAIASKQSDILVKQSDTLDRISHQVASQTEVINQSLLSERIKLIDALALDRKERKDHS